MLWRHSHHISSYDQQKVSDIAHFVKCSIITSDFPMTNRMQWATSLHILWKAVLSHLLLWPTACEWHCTFCKSQSHHLFSCGQQRVCGIIKFMKGSLITSFTINRQCVTLYTLWKAVSSPLFIWPTECEWHHILWKSVSSPLFLWPTGSVWHYTLCEMQSHHIFYYDQQGVCDIMHFVKGSLITSSHITNSEWVTVHILWKSVSSPLFLWQTASV